MPMGNEGTILLILKMTLSNILTIKISHYFIIKMMSVFHFTAVSTMV